MTVPALDPQLGARSRLARAVFTAVGACALASAVVFAVVPVDIVVEGVPYRVASGTTARDLVARGLVAARPGDLLSVTGAVVGSRRGAAPTVLFDGRAAGGWEPVYPGLVVASRRGADVRERVIEAVVAVPPRVEYTGAGADTVLAQVGAAGLVRARVGAVSHSVVDTMTIIRPGTPMVMRRRPFPPGTKLVALTFDDGPWPGQTQRILEILASRGVRATFFMVGLRVKLTPDIARRIVAEGHAVGNHTQNHPYLKHAPLQRVRDEMAGGAATIAGQTGVTPAWFRPPGGGMSPLVAQEATRLGERVCGWSVDPADWHKPAPEQIVQRVMGAVHPGAVVLLHDGGGDRNATIAALPAIIDQLRAGGYRFVTLDQLP